MKKYVQVSTELLHDIQSGRYKSGDKLPSINALAKEYACSRGTAIRAYQYLIEHQFVYVKNKSGYYSSITPEKKKTVSGYHLESGNPTVGSFHLPYAKQGLALALDRYQLESLDVGADGVSSVIVHLSKALADSGIYTTEQNLLLTMGIQQTVHVLCQMVFPNQGTDILIEEPTYGFVIDMLKAQGTHKVHTIQRTENGIDLETLETLFQTKKIKFFYLVTRNHNPLGTTLSIQQRQAIVRLAIKYDVYLAEDDYFLDANYIPKYTSLYYQASGDHCIYLGSMTKILPYLRIGFTIMPDELQQSYHHTVEEIMRTFYYTPPLISQSMLGMLIQNQAFAKSKDMLNQDLQKKIRQVQKMTAKWDPSIATYTGYDGYYASIRLHLTVSVDQLIERLQEKQVFLVSNRANFYHQAHFDNSARLSLAKLEYDQVDDVYPIIYQTIQELYQQNKKRKESSK